MTNTTVNTTGPSRLVRKIAAMIVMIGLASMSIAQVERNEASALSSFDNELLSLINEHRASKGLDAFVEFASLSTASLNWSNSMLARRNTLGNRTCPQVNPSVDTFLIHDSNANVGSQGVPPGTVRFGENIGWVCGFPGNQFPITWSYSAMPAKCLGQLDFASALMQFCGWIDSSAHRQSIEGSFTHIGIGTAFKATGSQLEPLSTTRFATAPVVAAGPTCDGRAVTINMNTNGGNGQGTGGNDVILGTPNDDVINGLGGDDRICGMDGRDRISGGPGVDRIFGGFGIDYISGDDGGDILDGEGGSDRMWGGVGNDLMLGDSGADRMFGGPGDDEMRGMGGQDFMWGDAGNDVMQGNFQTDNMWGGPGNDDMFGAGGKDSLFGEAGNDDLFGGNNTDYLHGGDGVDTANGGRGRDKPLVGPQTRASNGQLFGGSGCIAETTSNCQI